MLLQNNRRLQTSTISSINYILKGFTTTTTTKRSNIMSAFSTTTNSNNKGKGKGGGVGGGGKGKTTTTTTTNSPNNNNQRTKLGLVWYKLNDLRVYDHEPLYKAHMECEYVNHLMIIDPFWFGNTSYWFKMCKTGYHRTKFLLESIEDLKQNLMKHGCHLTIKYGETDQVMNNVLNEMERVQINTNANAQNSNNNNLETIVYTHQDICDEECRITKKVEGVLIERNQSHHTKVLKTFWGQSMYHVDDLPMPMNRFPPMYSNFRNEVEKKSNVRDCFPIPPKWKLSSPSNFQLSSDSRLPGIQDLIGEEEMNHYLALEEKEQQIVAATTTTTTEKRGVLDFKGGEREGIKRLQHYFFETDCLQEYKETRNGMLGANYSSKFSPWLAFGNLSPRYIYHQVKKYEQERIANKSTYWLIFELIWRDYFQFYGLHHGIQMFQLGGTQKNSGKQKWETDERKFHAWCRGLTGYPYIDANMRELNHTGFMSNRGRQNVASFLTKDLELDWRLGAEYFEKVLIDHDPCSNWGNWNYAAGVGSDPREGRYFNIVKQGHNYDKAAEYVKYWCPELINLPASQLHNANPVSSQFRKSLNITEDIYPVPIVPLKFGAYNPATGKGTDSKGGRAPFNNNRGRGGKRNDGGRGGGRRGGGQNGGNRNNNSNNDNNNNKNNGRRNGRSRLQHHDL